MPANFEAPTGGKRPLDLVYEALWFAVHTAIAVLVLILVICAITLTHPNPLASPTKLVATLLALLVPLGAGLLIARFAEGRIARHVWVAGLIFFTVTSVWVLGLPTGPGHCENCFALEKIQRTFFTLDHGSGLLGGNGLLIGTWVPLAMVGYALGARLIVRPRQMSAPHEAFARQSR